MGRVGGLRSIRFLIVVVLIVLFRLVLSWGRVRRLIIGRVLRRRIFTFVCGIIIRLWLLFCLGLLRCRFVTLDCVLRLLFLCGVISSFLVGVCSSRRIRGRRSWGSGLDWCGVVPVLVCLFVVVSFPYGCWVGRQI